MSPLRVQHIANVTKNSDVLANIFIYIQFAEGKAGGPGHLGGADHLRAEVGQVLDLRDTKPSVHISLR